MIYGTAAFLSGLATSLPEIMFWRCVTVAGACVEFVAALAWLTELFPDPRRREISLGWAQACGTLGNFVMAGAYFAFVSRAQTRPSTEIWPMSLRQAMRPIPIPLLAGDADVTLDLQAALTATYGAGVQ